MTKASRLAFPVPAGFLHLEIVPTSQTESRFEQCSSPETSDVPVSFKIISVDLALETPSRNAALGKVI